MNAPKCQTSYSTRWKPVNCKECGFYLGGSKEPATKKTKSCCPSAVVVTSTVEMSLISTKTSTRDDRCFVFKEGDSVFCTHKECMNVRATFVSSGRASDFVCKHADQCRDAVTPQKVFELTTQKIDSYSGDGSSKELLTELLGAESSLAAVVQVSDLSFAVRGFPSTNNTLGYSHVKIVDGVLVCSSKDTDCKSFVAKGKYERAKKFCVHLHAIFCTGGYSQETLRPSTSTVTMPSEAASTQRCKTLQLNLSRRIASDFITPALLKVVDEKNAGGWPSFFSPTATSCELCGENLGEDVMDVCYAW